MKAFIIHVNTNKKSVEYANMVLTTFHGKKNWEPELFVGVNAKTLSDYEQQYEIPVKQHSRAINFDEKLFQVKKSCFLNHYRLFLKCVELNEPIAVIEHDSHCLRGWENEVWDDVLVLNYNAAMRQPVFKHIWAELPLLKENGIDDIFWKIKYKYDDHLKTNCVMPGTGAYAITPNGAQKMLNAIHKYGWDQSDFIINTAFVRIQTIHPDYFCFGVPNLKMSHGQNL